MQWWQPVLVGVGGAVGTGVRQALSDLLPPVDGVPLTIAAINLTGAFLLGFLLQTLARLGDDTGRRRAVRLGVGTGVLGGFTTYSALALDTVLLADGRPVLALAWAGGTVVVGFLLSVLGIAAAAALGRRAGAA